MRREDEFISGLGLIGILVSLMNNYLLFGLFSAWIFLVPESITKLAEYLKNKNVERK